MTASPEELRETFALDALPDLTPRYNIAPSQALAVIKDGKRRVVSLASWGFDPGDGKPRVNARSEGIARQRPFAESWQGKRCVVLVDGFYEWRREPGESGKKQPFHVRRRDRAPFALAGVWRPGERGPTAAVLTTRAVGVVAALHDRMPVIVPASRVSMYVSGTTDEAAALLVPSDEGLEAVAVSTVVNSPRNDGPECLAPPEPPAQGALRF